MVELQTKKVETEIRKMDTETKLTKVELEIQQKLKEHGLTINDPLMLRLFIMNNGGVGKVLKQKFKGKINPYAR